MPVFQHINNFSTTLAEDVTAIETDIDITSAAGLSALFANGVTAVPLTMDDGAGNVEIVYCTSVASNTVTVTRAQEGTTGYAFSTGATIECRATAGSVYNNRPTFFATAPADTFQASYTTSNKVDFATDSIDPFSWFDNTTNRWQPTAAGVYFLEATIHVEDPPVNCTATIEIWNQTAPVHTYQEYIPDTYTAAPAWQASTAYSLGDIILPTTPNGYRYICTTAGTSAGSEPSFSTTVGATTADNTATWTNQAEDKRHWVATVSHILSMNGSSDYATVRVRHNDSVAGAKTYGSGTSFRGWRIN